MDYLEFLTNQVYKRDKSILRTMSPLLRETFYNVGTTKNVYYIERSIIGRVQSPYYIEDNSVTNREDFMQFS